MSKLTKLWQKMEYLTGIVERYQQPDYNPTVQELVNLHQDLRSCANLLQTEIGRISKK